MRFNDNLSGEFKGKTALVVGGSSGIGLGAAELLERRGAQVTVIGHDESVRRAVEALGGRVEGIRGDASSTDFMREAIAGIEAGTGCIDILVNSAAIVPLGDVVATTPEEWDRAMAVNLRSMYLACHFAVPAMIAKGGGAIINVASVQATACSGGVCAYAATKGAILSFTRSLAVDLGPNGIRSNAVSPGSIITPMQEYFADLTKREGQTREDVYEQFAKPVPLGRLGDVAETAELICFLASPRAGFCLGAEFVADGGLLGGLRLY